MGKVISFVSLKGGVGKTTLSASLATELANKYDKRVLLVDANYSAPNLGLHMDIISPGRTMHDVLSPSKTRMTGAIHEKHGVDVVPGNFMFNKEYHPMKLRAKLAHVKKMYDFVVVDSSPALNEEIISAMLASDSLFIVSTPDYPTLSCSMKIARVADQRGVDVSGIILNRVRKGNSQVSLSEVEESVGIPVVASIREDKKVGRSLYHRVPMPLYSKRSQFSKEVSKLGAAMIGLKDKKKGWRSWMNREPKREEVNREVLRESFYSSIFKS